MNKSSLHDEPSTVPSNANQECVGPSSSNAGRAPSCAGCPNQSICSSGGLTEQQQQQQTSSMSSQVLDIRTSLSSVSYTLLVLSGKGGVGKSTLCCQIAHTLASRGYNVGVLDVDICGPSVARMMGVMGREVHKTATGWTPVYANRDNLSVMSVSFLLADPDAAVVWRGPRKNGMIQQFLSETDWGELDYLIIDTPPGTSDEHISTVQFLQSALASNTEEVSLLHEDATTKKNNDSMNNSSCVLGGAIVITTPEEVSMADVRKELNFCQKTKLPVIGIVENMSSFQTRLDQLRFFDCSDPHAVDCTATVIKTIQERCPEFEDVMISVDVFPISGSGPQGMAKSYNVPYLGKVPLDPNLLECCEKGCCFVETCPRSPAVGPLNTVVDKILQTLPLSL